MLDRVYGRLLELCPLSSGHSENLRQRGLDQQAIESGRYGSYPDGRNRSHIVSRLSSEFSDADLLGVPGFFRDGSNWRLSGWHGLLIPIRNQDGLIVSLKVRDDDDKADPKYTTLSSTRKGGPGSGCHVHIPLSASQRNHGTVRVTEGELKADVATHLSCTPTISIPGVSQWRMAIPLLRKLGAREVLVAFDADYRTNPHVQRSVAQCLDALVAEGYSVSQETWDPGIGKGIDDVLVAGGRCRIVTNSHDPELRADTSDRTDRRFPTVEVSMNKLIEMVSVAFHQHPGKWREIHEALTSDGIREALAKLTKTQERLLVDAIRQNLNPSPDEDLLKKLSQLCKDLRSEFTLARKEEAKAARASSSPTKHLQQVAMSPERLVTPDGEAFVLVDEGTHRRVIGVRTNSFDQWLTSTLFRQHQEAVSGSAIADVVRLVEAMAKDDGKTVHIGLRIQASENGDHWYDLGDDQWRAVRMTPQGWEVVTRPPVYFRRYPKSAFQVAPERGGDLEQLHRYLRVESDHDWKLLTTCLASYFISGGPRPCIVITGEQGSCKSSATRVIRSLVDPSVTELTALGRDPDQLSQIASSSYLLAFDNISHIDQDQSDALCRIVTGGAIEKRKLYTDSESHITKTQCCVVMNGIGNFVTSQDLIDRSILVRLSPIPQGQRQGEVQFWEDFERDRPKILGALMDHACGALKHLAEVKTSTDYRMNDYARLAIAMGRYKGWPDGCIEAALQSNLDSQVADAIEESVVAQAVIRHSEQFGHWSGTPSDLLAELRRHWDHNAGALPKTPSKLGKDLERAIPALRKVGVMVEGRRAGNDPASSGSQQ